MELLGVSLYLEIRLLNKDFKKLIFAGINGIFYILRGTNECNFEQEILAIDVGQSITSFTSIQTTNMQTTASTTIKPLTPTTLKPIQSSHKISTVKTTKLTTKLTTQSSTFKSTSINSTSTSTQATLSTSNKIFQNF